MNRVEIEIKLNRDRAWLLERLSEMSEDELRAPRTFSEHDDTSQWSFADHFIHTTLIERNWNAMFRRHLTGEQGLERRVRDDGSPQSMDEIMAGVHAWTEEWKAEHVGEPFVELVRIGLATRADTLALLAELDDDQTSSSRRSRARRGPTARSAGSWPPTPTTGGCTGTGRARTRSPRRPPTRERVLERPTEVGGRRRRDDGAVLVDDRLL